VEHAGLGTFDKTALDTLFNIRKLNSTLPRYGLIAILDSHPLFLALLFFHVDVLDLWLRTRQYQLVIRILNGV
jgi:hypothetical protein